MIEYPGMCDREMKECVGCEYILMGGRTLGVGVPGRAWVRKKIKKKMWCVRNEIYFRCDQNV